MTPRLAHRQAGKPARSTSLARRPRRSGGARRWTVSILAGQGAAGWVKVSAARTARSGRARGRMGGHRRARGRWSNLHLGARDDTRQEFVMLGKTFKGLTDAHLASAKPGAGGRRLGPLRSTCGRALVVEVAFNDMPGEPGVLPGGLALAGRGEALSSQQRRSRPTRFGTVPGDVPAGGPVEGGVHAGRPVRTSLTLRLIELRLIKTLCNRARPPFEALATPHPCHSCAAAPATALRRSRRRRVVLEVQLEPQNGVVGLVRPAWRGRARASPATSVKS